MMKIGRRIAEGIPFLKIEITISLIRRTNVMLMPIPSPLKMLVVTPSEEQRPMFKTRSGFSLRNPFVKIESCLFISLRLLQKS